MREIARQGIAKLWRQTGDSLNQVALEKIIDLNREARYAQAALNATDLLEIAPALAEVWNQRSLAHHRLKLYTDAIRDGRRAMEFNPFHFECLIRMGRCHEQLDDAISALDYFRQALAVPRSAALVSRRRGKPRPRHCFGAAESVGNAR